MRGKKPVRCGVFREDVLQPNGTFQRVQRTVVLGPVSGLSERAAWKLFQPYLDRVNSESVKMPPRTGMTLEQFVKEWRTSVAINLSGHYSTGDGIAPAGAHHSEVGRFAIDGDKHEERSNLCGISWQWSFTEDG